MTKKSDIIELLKNDTDVDTICSELEVSTSYVYRIKREVDESKGNTEESNESESNSSDDMVIDPPGRDGTDVEGDNEDVETKETKRNSDKTDKVGGVKKRKRVHKKVQKEKVNSAEHVENRGVKLWIQKKWKKILLRLSLLILLVIVILSQFFRKTTKETNTTVPVIPSRFPTIQH